MFLFGILEMLSHMIKTKSVVSFYFLKVTMCLKYLSGGVSFSLERVWSVWHYLSPILSHLKLLNVSIYAFQEELRSRAYKPWWVTAESYCWGLLFMKICAENKSEILLEGSCCHQRFHLLISYCRHSVTDLFCNCCVIQNGVKNIWLKHGVPVFPALNTRPSV